MRKAAAILLPLSVLLSCTGKVETPSVGPKDDDSEQELVVVDGKVTFKLSLDKIPEEYFLCGVLSADLSGRTVRVGGKDYPVQKSTGGGFYAQIDESPFGSYSAALLSDGSDSFYGSSPYNDIRLPRTIFPADAGKYAAIPLFCEWKEGDGPVLGFTAPYSLLRLKCDGAETVSAALSSDSPLTGTFSYIRSQNTYTTSSAQRRVIVNCDGAADLSGGLPVLLLPGVDAKLKVRLCDASSKMSEQELSVFLAAGQAKTVTLTHNPASNLVFFEGFDRCVWGGNPVEGTDGFTPWQSVGTKTGGADCTGREDASFSCASSSAGAGYVQDSFAESSPAVEESSYMSAAYVRSRGFDRYNHLLRVQEYDGCVSAGTVGFNRGWVRIKSFAALEGLSDVTVRFNICLQPGCTDVIDFRAEGGGVITAAKVDGNAFTGPDYLTHKGTVSNFRMAAGDVLDVPTSLSSGMKWQAVEVTVRGASETTVLAWLAETNETKINGYWLDEISVEKVAGSWDRNAAGSLRLLYWNIQNAMWGDQGNNYDNFVAEVKKYDPDVCVWCEGRSNYLTGTATFNSDNPYLTFDVGASSGWAALAARYGHKYLGLAHRNGDNFPQIITSKYPVECVLTLGNIKGEKTIGHGAGMFRIDCDGTELNVVSLHLIPDSGEEADEYREYEIGKILSTTVSSATYSGRGNWIVLGDFNSRSQFDRGYYDLGDSAYLTHQYIADNSSLVDLMHGMYPDRLISSTTYSRIDFIYLSPDIYARVTDACTVVDSWATAELQSTGLSNFRLPSDHRPILVQFDFGK